MTRHLALISFTDQGVRNVQNSSQRAAGFRTAVDAAGGKVLSQYWAVGQFDGCVLFEAPNEEAAASLLLALAKAGDVRTQTLRLYDESEFASIVSKV